MHKVNTINELFCVPKFSLGYILAWPSETRSWAQQVFGFFTIQYFFWLSAACFVKIYWIIVIDFDVLLLADAMTPGFTVAATLIKLSIFLRAHRGFHRILKELEEKFTEDFHAKAAAVNREKSRFLFKVTAFNYSLPNITGFAYFLLPLFAIIFKWLLGLPVERKLPLLVR